MQLFSCIIYFIQNEIEDISQIVHNAHDDIKNV